MKKTNKNHFGLGLTIKSHEAFAMSGATTPREAADGASAEDPGGSLRSLADALECAVCTALMVDPVVTADGHSYCRACILEWFPERSIRTEIYVLGF